MADDTLSSSCGSSSPEEVKFRQVTVGSSTPRSVVRKMWAQGRLAGLFNIPDEEVFNACQDFVMEVPLLPRDAPHVQREAELGAQIGMLKKEVELLRCSNRSLKADNQRLQAEHKRLRHEFTLASHRLSKSAEEHAGLSKRANQADAEARRAQEQLAAEREEIAAERREMAEDLRSERQHVHDLSAENTSLRERLAALTRRQETEEQGFFLLTQNDVLNKKLLQSFMHNFDNLVSPSVHSFTPLDDVDADDTWPPLSSSSSSSTSSSSHHSSC